MTDAARFAADVARLVPADARVALAVSGGADSMALLTLAHAAIPARIVVATVDHGLRAANSDEAAMVARHCAALGVSHATLTPAAPVMGASIQAQARRARYAALAAWMLAAGADMLFTAHHADDQAETLLMRANRGAGLSGLAAIRASTTIAGVAVARPLLAWRRATLRAIVVDAGVPFADDPANADPRHDRTHIRALLAATPLLDPASLARSAAALADSESALRFATDRWWDERARPSDAGFTVDVAGLPRELRRRLALRALAATGEPASRIEPLIDSLDRGIRATQGTAMVSPSGSVWRFEQAPPRRAR